MRNSSQSIMSNVDSVCSGQSTQRKTEFECEDDIPPTNKPCIDFQPDDRWHIKEETADAIKSSSDVHDHVSKQNQSDSKDIAPASEHLQHNADHKTELTAFNGDINRPVCTEKEHLIKEKVHREECATSNKLKDCLDNAKQSVTVGKTCSEQESVVSSAMDTSCSSSSSRSTSHEGECEPGTFSSATKCKDTSKEHTSDKAKQSISVDKNLENEEKAKLKTPDLSTNQESSFQNERQSVIKAKPVHSANSGAEKVQNTKDNEKSSVQNGQENSTDSVWHAGLSDPASKTLTDTQKILSSDETVSDKNDGQTEIKKLKPKVAESKAVNSDKIKIEPEDDTGIKNKPDLVAIKVKMESEDSSSMSRDSDLGPLFESITKSDDKNTVESSDSRNVVGNSSNTSQSGKSGENSTIKSLLSSCNTSSNSKHPSSEKDDSKPKSSENLEKKDNVNSNEHLYDTKAEIGKYNPIKFPTNGTLYIGKDDVILESPSFLVPLVVKEPNKFVKLDGEQPVTGKKFDSQKIFDSAAGQFLVGLGLSRVKEWYHKDMKRLKARQIRKQGKQVDLETEYQEHRQAYIESRQANSPFTFPLRKCEICEFKTESKVVMEAHYSIPHLTSRKEYRCNYCVFCTRDPAGILLHFKTVHGKLASLELPMQYHECHFCPFQSHLKAKVNSHMNKCQKNFISMHNQAPPVDFDFPTITAKPVTLTDIEEHKTYMANAAKASAVKITLAPQTNLQKGNGRKRLAAVLNKLTANQNAQLYKQMATPKSHAVVKPLIISQQNQQQTSQQQLQQVTPGGIQLPPGIVITRPRVSSTGRQTSSQAQIMLPRVVNPVRQVISSSRKLVPLLNNKALAAANTPQISITPTTKVPSVTATATVSTTQLGQKQGTSPQPVALFTNLALGGSSTQNKSGVVVTVQPTKTPQSTTTRSPRLQSPYQRHTAPPPHGTKGNSSGNSFVMCEICDAYIKDLEELRSHMQSVHKVKIHPKMLVSRPPLNCQKCQWRFFTDQGLERHLLGAHGLVTSNMQELANRNQDGGRCLICGAVFTYKLVNHMTVVHKVTLKPAHLSYKCTVCTATFALYRLFENHVYTIHSGAVKRLNEESSSQASKKIKLSESEKLVPDKQEEVSETQGDELTEDDMEIKCYHCGKEVTDLQDHLRKHLKKCSIKLCRIETCQKCLCSFDGMLVLHTSDFGLDDDEEEEDDDENENAAEKTNEEIKMEVDETINDGQDSNENSEKEKEKSDADIKGVEDTKQIEEKMDIDLVEKQEMKITEISQKKDAEENKDAQVKDEKPQLKDPSVKEPQLKDTQADEEPHLKGPSEDEKSRLEDTSVDKESQVKDPKDQKTEGKDSSVGKGPVVKASSFEKELETKDKNQQVKDPLIGKESQENNSAVSDVPLAKERSVEDESQSKNPTGDETPDVKVKEEHPMEKGFVKDGTSQGSDSLKNETL